jgi:hypothetical protein
MAAGATYEPIATTSASGSAMSITFSSIPSTYTDLVIIVNGKITTGLSALAYEFNGETSAANYSYTRLQGNGSSASSSRVSADQAIGFIAETASMDIINIMNYANTNTYKTSISRANSMYSSDGRTGSYVSLWRSTAAINSVTIKCGVNFNSGTTFTLYGIKAA